jgi:hypothetical protein
MLALVCDNSLATVGCQRISSFVEAEYAREVKSGCGILEEVFEATDCESFQTLFSFGKYSPQYCC